MKKLMPLLALVILLSGCWGCVPASPAESSGTADRPTPPATQTILDSPIPSAEASPPLRTPAPTPEEAEPVPTPVPPPTPTPAPTSTPASGADEPADEAILAAYEKAEEAWGWFEIAPMPLDRDDQRTVGEQVYCRVDYPGIKTLADLRGYLKSLFSDGLVEELLPVDGTQYVELDGALYTIDGGRGADITKGEETVQVLRDSVRRPVHRSGDGGGAGPAAGIFRGGERDPRFPLRAGGGAVGVCPPFQWCDKG